MTAIPDTDPGSPNVGDITPNDRFDAARRWIDAALNQNCHTDLAARQIIAILKPVAEP